MTSPVAKPEAADEIMTKDAVGGGGRGSSTISTADSDNSVKGEKKTQSSIAKSFSTKVNSRENLREDILKQDGNGNDLKDLEQSSPSRRPFTGSSAFIKRGFSERMCGPGIENLNPSSCDQSMTPETIAKDIRVFVGTWNLGGNTPNNGLNLQDFLQVDGSADIYVLGFQEIVPLSAGNVLVMEDNEPALKWLALIHYTLNKPYNDSESSSENIFNKPSLKALSKTLRGDNELLKTCNCDHVNSRLSYCDQSMDNLLSLSQRVNYQLVASKQMVGLFLSIWARRELVKGIGHLRISCMGRGIMGYLGNKGCISISMTLHQTSFCFVCSHLASGEKEGDELRRNSDVAETLKSTYFPRICRNPNHKIPERILDHDRMIWLGDLNYRINMSYEEARLLVEDNDWNSLLRKDQLIREKRLGKVFNGWEEGKIMFAPTYKYSQNSDSYAGENTKSKRKRRTPAWCDRILWRGDGIEQLSYIRGESRFSDHRPVCAVFEVEVVEEVPNKAGGRLRKGYSCAGTGRLDYQDSVPQQRHSIFEFN